MPPTLPKHPHSSNTSKPYIKYASPPTFEQEDPFSTSGSQSTIRYRSNSAMEEVLDDSANTTTPDALTTDTKLRNKQKLRARQKEKRKIARLLNPRLNSHDKDEMS